MGYKNEISSRSAQRLSKVSYFLGVASLAGWLFLYLSFLGQNNFPLLYSLVGLVLITGALGVVVLVPKARNLHGSAALASVAIALIDAVVLLFWEGDSSVIVNLLFSGLYGGLQTIAALAALLLAALSFQGMRSTPVDRKPVSDAGVADEQALRTPGIANPPRALLGLWVITSANLGGGLLLWIFNFLRQVEAEIDIFDRLSNREYREVMESAAGWQLFAVPFIEFGILVLVITLATAAIVESTKRMGR